MPDQCSNSPRPASAIDAKSIKIPSISTPPEVQSQSPAGERLMSALWQSPERCHQIGILDRQTLRFENIPTKDAAEAVTLAQKLSDEDHEVYFACAEYQTADSRTAANASGARALWLDIDCGEHKAATGKGYATLEEAEDALKQFYRDTGLPEPTHIVHSGGGLHVYWVVDDNIPRDTWQSHARQLKALTKARGLLADDSRTADIASVLRIPGTLNHKYSPPMPVTLEYEATEPIEQTAMLDAIAMVHSRLCNTAETQPHGHPSIVDKASIPPDLKRLTSALAKLEPDCDEETWKLRRLAPLAQAAHDHPEYFSKLYELGRSWSSGELRGEPSRAWGTPGGNGLTGEQVFDDIWRRFQQANYSGTPATLGTIYHDAKEAGWVDPEAFQRLADTPAESDSMLDPLASIQRQFALINLKGRVWVLDGACLEAKPDQPARQLALSSRSDGSLLISRAVAEQFPNENAKNIVKNFFTSPQTLCYQGVEFNPAGTTKGYLNLWVGPTATPQAGDWQLIRDFLRDTICDGDNGAYQYLTSFLAHALQHPEEKPGVVIVMIGGQGCGKGTLGRVLRKIWGATYLQVHSMEAVTGNFNGSLERAFIVFMDEALFVGDRRSTDALKSLVTEPVIQINEKHQPARQIRSCHRYVVATNADHWKHTEKDDRRDFVLRVSEARKGDHAYWRELHGAIGGGAVEAMVHELLLMDLSGFNVRDKPETRELLDQKLQSLDPIPRWWYDCLQEGAITDDDKWPDFIGTAYAIEDVVEFSGNKLFRKPAPIDLIRAMQRLCPSARKAQCKVDRVRQRGLVLPSLEQAREEFEWYIGRAIDW